MHTKLAGEGAINPDPADEGDSSVWRCIEATASETYLHMQQPYSQGMQIILIGCEIIECACIYSFNILIARVVHISSSSHLLILLQFAIGTCIQPCIQYTPIIQCKSPLHTPPPPS